MKYVLIPARDVPRGLRFDTPPECQGQILEVSYGDSEHSRDLHCAGAPYKRVTDRSDQSVSYYRRLATKEES